MDMSAGLHALLPSGQRRVHRLTMATSHASTRGAVQDTGHLSVTTMTRYHQLWDQALGDYERAAKADPTLIAVDRARGKLWFEAGRPQPAQAALDRFLAQHPDHIEARVTWARLFVSPKQHVAAHENYSHAIAQLAHSGSSSPDYCLEQARALAAAGEQHIDTALRGLDAGIEKLGPLVTLQLYVFKLKSQKKQYDRALARLDTLASQSPRQKQWLARRGALLAQSSQSEQARKDASQPRAAAGGGQKNTKGAEARLCASAPFFFR